MALVQGPVSPGHRITVATRADLNQEELTALIGHKGEPWVGDMIERWNDPDYDSYNLTAIAYEVCDPHSDSPTPPRAVAHAWIGVDGDTGLVGHIYTHPLSRKLGLATSLLHTLIEVFFKQRGGSFLVLGTDNQAAARLYMHLGFRPLGAPSLEGNIMLARGVHPGCGPERAYLGSVNRRSIHISFEQEFFSNNGGLCNVEPIHPRHLPGCTLLLNAPSGPPAPKLPGLRVDSGSEAELALINAIREHRAGSIVCAVAVDPVSRRVHALGVKRRGQPGEELGSKAQVYATESCTAAEHTLRCWIEDRVRMLNQGVLLGSE